MQDPGILLLADATPDATTHGSCHTYAGLTKSVTLIVCTPNFEKSPNARVQTHGPGR